MSVIHLIQLKKNHMELYRLLIIYNSIDVKSLEHLFWWWNCQGINCGSQGFYFLRIQNPDVCGFLTEFWKPSSERRDYL